MSSHSNPKIVKRNRKSRYGQPVSPYDSEDDDDGGGDVDDDWISDVSFYLYFSFQIRFINDY